MKRIFIVSAIVCFCMGMMSPAKAQLSNHSDQTAEESNFSVHVGCDIPFGAFAQKSVTDVTLESDIRYNGAAPGASLGLQYLYRFEGTTLEGLGHNIFLSADFIWNNMCKNYRTYYKNNGSKAPIYFNVPVLIGYNFTRSFTSNIALSAQAGLGVDLFFRTRDLVNGYYQYYKMSYAFALGAGAEIIFLGHYGLGVQYNFLGNQGIRLKGTTSSAKSDSDDENSEDANYLYKGSVSTLSIRFAYHF